MSEIKLEWQGETIKQTVAKDEQKLNPDQILNSLSQVRNQIHQMENSKAQLDQQLNANDANIKSAKEFEARLKPFEDKCTELQVKKLKLFIRQIHKDWMEKAKKSAMETIEKDTNAYGPDSLNRIAYLDYQKLLATSPKIAMRISAVIIKKYLYEEPVFDNPFLTTSKD